MTIHRFKLKDLDAQFIQQLKTEYKNEDVEITFWLRPKAVLSESLHLTEKQFWNLIEKLDWEKIGHNDAVIAPVVDHLSTLSIEAIKRFDDILSEKLYFLDGKKYAQHIGQNAYKKGQHFSADIFLYARCCVVANGEEFYKHVFENPSEMPKNLTFGALLRIASEAYYRKTGEKFQYIPAYIYETFANSSAWEGEGMIEKILKV